MSVRDILILDPTYDPKEWMEEYDIDCKEYADFMLAEKERGIKGTEPHLKNLYKVTPNTFRMLFHFFGDKFLLGVNENDMMDMWFRTCDAPSEREGFLWWVKWQMKYSHPTNLWNTHVNYVISCFLGRNNWTDAIYEVSRERTNPKLMAIAYAMYDDILRSKTTSVIGETA